MTGDQLKDLRESAGLSRTELGTLMGFRGNAKRINNRVYDYEVGRKGITQPIEMLIKNICEK